jgi:hypothetical protein
MGFAQNYKRSHSVASSVARGFWGAYCRQARAKTARGGDVGGETSRAATALPRGRAATAVPHGRAATARPPTQRPGSAARSAGRVRPRATAARPPTQRRIADPGPRLRQLIGVCGWAAVLGGVGLVLGIRGLIGVIAGDPPGWYEPSAIIAGVVGISLTVGSYLTVQRARAPWVLLGCASFTLALAMVFTSVAF